MITGRMNFHFDLLGKGRNMYVERECFSISLTIKERIINPIHFAESPKHSMIHRLSFDHFFIHHTYRIMNMKRFYDAKFHFPFLMFI